MKKDLGEKETKAESVEVTRQKWQPTHRLLIHGIRRVVRRQGDHWITQGGENFYAGFAEEIIQGEPKKRKMSALLRAKELILSGHAGAASNGTVVDMREYPNAIPIPPH